MQVKLFTIPVGDSGAALQEMNAFLRGNKILEVENQLVSNEHGAYWCFCVHYIEQAYPKAGGKRGAKVDYRKVLDEAVFKKFSKLREIRKNVAAEEGISAFIIFTDEELAELAKLDKITEKNMLGIKGIGEKKVARFAKYFITKPESDEAEGIPD
jgi:superfamily II DNA helicase RecQ